MAKKIVWTRCYLCRTPESVPGTGGVCSCCQHRTEAWPNLTWEETIREKLVQAGAPAASYEQWCLPCSTADFNLLRRLSYEGRALFCSTAKLDDRGGTWMKRFRTEAAAHGAEVKIEGGDVYVVWGTY